MSQLALDFASCDRRPVLVRYSDHDRAFFESTPLLDLPASFLIESRAQRLGCSVGELRACRSYELALELADETAILGSGPLAKTCRMPATRLDNATLEAAVKLAAAERAEAWAAFLASQGGVSCGR